jgi:hypothetical protein
MDFGYVCSRGGVLPIIVLYGSNVCGILPDLNLGQRRWRTVCHSERCAILFSYAVASASLEGLRDSFEAESSEFMACGPCCMEILQQMRQSP